MAEKRRVTLKNNNNAEDAKILVIPSECVRVDDFLRLASQKLNLPARKIFTENGAVIDDLDAIRDNDVIFVSAGEPFRQAGAAASSSSAGAPKKDQTLTYSIAVMGPGSVGKSALTLRFVQGIFVKDYDPTIEDAYRKNTSVDEEACVLDILDTAGQEDYTALRSTWMRERDGFLLVYSVADRSTFEALQGFYDQLQALHEDDIPPIILIANKCDLINKRVVSPGEGKKLSDSFRNCSYLETSAKTGENIEKAFHDLIRKMREKQERKAGGGKDYEKRGKKKFCAIL